MPTGGGPKPTPGMGKPTGGIPTGNPGTTAGNPANGKTPGPENAPASFETLVSFRVYFNGSKEVAIKEEAIRKQISKIGGATYNDGQVDVKFQGTIEDLKKLEANVKRFVESAVMISPLLVEGNWSKKNVKAKPEDLENALKEVAGVKEVQVNAAYGKVTIVATDYDVNLPSALTDSAQNSGFYLKVTSHSTLSLTIKEGDLTVAKDIVADFLKVRGVIKAFYDEATKTYSVLIKPDLVGKWKLFAVAKEKGIKVN